MLNLPGGVTGVGKAWIATGWRAARVTDQDDPWAVLGASVIPEPGAVSAWSGIGEIPGTAGGFPGGIGLTGDGGPANPGAFNRVWINAQISSGKKIVDIGQKLNSPFHQLEKRPSMDTLDIRRTYKRMGAYGQLILCAGSNCDK